MTGRELTGPCFRFVLLFLFDFHRLGVRPTARKVRALFPLLFPPQPFTCFIRRCHTRAEIYTSTPPGPPIDDDDG
jgi:hypothetical protein